MSESPTSLPWLARLLVRVKIAVAFLGCTVVALGLDAWLRFWVLLRYRNDEAGRIAAFNRGTRAWGTSMFSFARWAVGLRVTVEGPVPASGRYLVVANHQSSLDIPLLIATFPALNLKFVAMEQLRHGKPTISIVLRHGGFVFVGKSNVGEDLAAMGRFAAEVGRFDGSPVIFPAGRLERGHGPRPFHLAGIEVLRRGSRLPILPVAIQGMSPAPSIGHLLGIVGGRVTVRVSEPIPWEVVERDVRGTYRWLEEKIYADVAEMRGDRAAEPAARATSR